MKRFLEDTGNKREYLLSKYEEPYTYVDFAIDTLGSNIRFYNGMVIIENYIVENYKELSYS